MTCNQLILLCQIYRGTEAREFKIGTWEDDLKILKRMKLITDDEITPKGDKKIKSVLSLLD